MAAAPNAYKPDNKALAWIEERLPIIGFMRSATTDYYAPKNFNVMYYFGSLALLVLVNQIVTGIFLTMHFKPSAAEAFDSVEYIMRDVQGGYYCPCHHSRYDIAGRVYQGVPAPKNMVIPPYHFVDDTTVQIGVNPQEAG